MGFAVSQALTSRGDWDVHIFDMNPETGKAAADKLGASFHEVDVRVSMGEKSVGTTATSRKRRRRVFVSETCSRLP